MNTIVNVGSLNFSALYTDPYLVIV